MTDNLLLTLFITNVFDILSTLYVLKNGGRELNPRLAEWFRDDDPDVVMLRIKVLLLSIVYLGTYFGALPLWALATFVAGYVGLALYNLRSVIRVWKRTH